VKGVIARGSLSEDALVELGKTPDGAFATAIPVPVTRDLLARGHERFDIYCASRPRAHRRRARP
jgi:hypothetical protein